eukprot:548797_1
MTTLSVNAITTAICLCLVVSGNDNLFKTFQEWKLQYNRAYNSLEEESLKYSIWLSNIELIENHNSKNATYKMDVNQFTDMTHEEFKSYVGSCDQNDKTVVIYYTIPNIINAPSSVNWTAKGVVTPVKNQGACGGCWSFGATGSMECNYAIKYGKLTSLSEEQLIDCDTTSNGCNGGTAVHGMEYSASEGGLCTEVSYPYTAGKNGTVCKAQKCGNKYNAPDKSSPVLYITPTNSTALRDALVLGCVGVGVEADQPAFQHYKSGVITSGCGQNPPHNDHSVIVVGYGVENGVDYWLVKNSWGTNWGENGYVKICRNCNQNGIYGECGILKAPKIPNYK